MKHKAIIVDLDGTLCNIEHRRHYVTGPKKDWKNFGSPENLSKDTPNIWCVELVDAMRKLGYHLLFVSGRMQAPGVAEATMEWLTTVLDLPPIAFKDGSMVQLFMRKDNDFREDTIIKKEIYEECIKDKYCILMAVDDRASVVKMWRELGITCLQCDEGNF